MTDSTNTPSSSLPTWDLTDLYANENDPSIDTDLNRLEEKAVALERNYKGRLETGELTVKEFKTLLDQYEELLRLEAKIGGFSHLHFATDTKDPARGALNQKVRERTSETSTHLLFISLEIGRMDETTFQLYIQAPELAAYRHFLVYERSLAAHHLSEAEEKILEKTANVRGRAFRRLFTEITSRMEFPMEVEGKTRYLTQSEILAYNYDPNRELRRRAAEALAGVLQDHAHVLTFIFNTILHEKEILDTLRGFSEPEESRHLANELEAKDVETMVNVVRKNYHIVADYYRLKSRLLGIEQLTHYDRYAPLEQEKINIPFEEAYRIVIDSYSSFSPEMAQLGKDFFHKSWIDAPVKPGKRGGAFCAGISPDHHPYILLNYTGKPRDVMTLAHELGHGIHDRLASEQHILDYHPVLPLAETASTFGELLVFNQLYSALDTSRKKLALLCEKIEDTFATVFRQIAMFTFEQKLHRMRRSQGELTTEAISDLWQECQQEMFSDSLVLGESHRPTWMYIPHIVHTPFYVYAYAFGELLVLSLFSRYEKEGKAFVKKYLKLLAAGGSASPRVLLGDIGVDISQESFWQGGCDLINDYVQRAYALSKNLEKVA